MPYVWSPHSTPYIGGDSGPLFDGHIVTIGDRYANRMVKYYEDTGLAVVGKRESAE